MDRKFGRKKSNREHMIRNLVTSLILYERITTTEPRAKEVKKEIDHLITIGKKQTLSSYRQILAYVFDVNAAKKITEVLLPRFESRSSGFTHLFHAGNRLGDSAPMVIIELIPAEAKKSVSSAVEKTTKPKETAVKSKAVAKKS